MKRPIVHSVRNSGCNQYPQPKEIIMTILVTGATGTVGRHVVEQLVKRDADVRVLVRDPSKSDFPASVSVVQGDLLDVDALRNAFSGVSTLFLLNAVVPDEYTQALIALNLARETGIERIVYLSVIHSDLYVNVPHFAGKYGVERMIEQMGFNATILRPAYFIENDLTIKEVVTGYGIYPMPIGSKGLAMVDTRDIGEVAALELLRREQSAVPLPIERINLVGPDTLTGQDIAAIWTDVLGRPIAYPGEDTAAFEQNLLLHMPSWMAYDMRLMSERFITEGMLPDADDVDRLTTLLGRPLYSYREFATQVAASI
ncbi:NmrA/HSCARG family protein [Halomonas janggokensis]|uniref:SDR family oxidoreductase n=1 Tax=Vreelandella janggokensis TaxID=370767 RepID=UPI0022A7B0FE|nr:NmrA/HSCARG family protein [Halomonas janggokensis]MCZ0930413.1 NmrA/HSCARG family protein [Halomonas janggokensis]